jgi:hypothetical protein
LTTSSIVVTTITAGTDTAVGTSTGVVVIWNTSTLQSITNRGATTNQAINITNLTDSTGTNNGALTVAGGVGITGNLSVGGVATFGGVVYFNGTATYVYSTNTVYTDNIIELHTPANGVSSIWNNDDGKDIGFRFHYYKGGDTNAALVLANDSKFLEWYSTGADTANGYNFTGTTYGTFKTGEIQLVSVTSATSTSTGALIVSGGVGIGGSLYATNIYSNGYRVITTNDPSGGGTVANIIGGADISVSTMTNTVTISNTSTFQTVTNRGSTTTNQITHGGLIPSVGTHIDQIYTVSVTLTLTTIWQDTGIVGNQLATGSYLVQCIASDSSVGGQEVNTYYTGVMSWYSGSTSETTYDEIILHRAGAASGTGTVFLQVLRESSSLALQIAGTTTNSGSSTYSFSFRRLI